MSGKSWTDDEARRAGEIPTHLCEPRSASATLVQAAQAVVESWARADRPDIMRVHISRLEGAVLDETCRAPGEKPEAVAMAIRLARFEAFGEALGACDEEIASYDSGTSPRYAAGVNGAKGRIGELRSAAKPAPCRASACPHCGKVPT